MRRTRTRRLTAGTALLATVLHVALLSLHIATSATLAFAGEATARSRLGLVICSPATLQRSRSAASPTERGAPAPDNSGGATFCPVCTGVTPVALLLPSLAALPVYHPRKALDSGPTATPADPAPRREMATRRSRAPPALA